MPDVGTPTTNSPFLFVVARHVIPSVGRFSLTTNPTSASETLVTSTRAPSTGAPPSSVTLPRIVRVWADAAAQVARSAMTTSAAVGELAVELLIGGPGRKSAPFAPERFDELA